MRDPFSNSGYFRDKSQMPSLTISLLIFSNPSQSAENDMKKEEKSAAKLAAKKDKAQAKVEDLRAKIDDMNFSETEFNAFEEEKLSLERDLSKLEETVDTLSAKLEGRLAFNYSDPVRGFDRSKVKGLVARLISVKQPDHAAALEVVAGGKLFQVVVDEAITGKALLSKGKLARRVTIIPLDKIQPKRIGNAIEEKAKSIAAELSTTAFPAIELVGFDEEVRNAVEYVFGATIVVDGMKAANMICDVTKKRTVTLEGDVYDPSGTISGGSRDNLGSTLAKLSQLTEVSKEFADKQSRLKVVNAELQALTSASARYFDLRDKLELASAELAGVEKHLSQTTYGMLLGKYDSMTKEVNDARKEFDEMQIEKDSKSALYHELKEKELELTREREAKLTEIDETIKKAKLNVAEKAKNSREVSSF